jgi:hypothetical protein
MNNSKNIIDELHRLSDLKKLRVISEEEFLKVKNKF